MVSGSGALGTRGPSREDRERCVNMEGCLQATRALAKKPPTSKV